MSDGSPIFETVIDAQGLIILDHFRIVIIFRHFVRSGEILWRAKGRPVRRMTLGTYSVTVFILASRDATCEQLE